MAQGAAKKSGKSPLLAKKSKQPQAKSFRVAKPQKAKARTTADKLKKKYSAGLAAKTEKLLGERVGHLELIGKGKKADKDKGEKFKGGSRKFG